ncbi:helix-turn-helix domain-containing protein [Dactylosporangium roseum]|uniref:Helix-turn-helix domain-containing protein n=1 Tax=Dactylosporangium roseum TaxID=47989 RepID=A0ABY5ZGB6_9ACTN|nr:helix-turn-helix domain-containing protein [Dactylosporangium roseum]
MLTGEQVAALLKTTPRFVRRLVQGRRIEYVKVGRLVRFCPEAVADYIDRNRITPLGRADVRRQIGRAA